MMLRLIGFACLTIISSAILFVAGLLAYFLLDREPPVEIIRAEVLTPVVKPGGKLVVRTSIRITRECAAHVDRVVLDSHTHRQWLPEINYERPPQGLGEFVNTTEIDVPDNFESGKATYRAIPNYYCNWLHRYYWPIATDGVIHQFEVASPQ